MGVVAHAGPAPHEDCEDDSPKEACGVFAVYAPGQPVAHLTYLGLYALQHRGQESAGMAVSDGDEVTVVKDMGLVSHVFDDRTLAPLTGHLAIGHTRYSTTGSSTWRNAQPVYRGVGDLQFALGHNGNLVNTAELATEAGMLPGTVTSDSDLVAELVAVELEQVEAARGPGALGKHPADGAVGDGPAATLDGALLRVLPDLRGAFSFVFMDESHIIGVRDPNGFRPLCLGRLEDGGWVLASESPALDVVGAHFVREVDPGEMVVIDGRGVRSERPFPSERLDPKLCLFEFVYFARPDTRLYNRSVHHARVRQGELLAEQAPVDADMVMGVPESGLPAAEGYARASGIPYGQGLVKNRYIGRTFIAPSQEMRALGVRMKLNPLRENLAGKRVVVVDDSVVRGTTQKQIVKMLRESGVTEVHLRLTSPPIKWSCFYGIDTGKPSELLAANLSVEEIRDYLNVDTIAYITLDRLISSTGTPGSGFCDACFTGVYPVEVPVSLSKAVLEGAAGACCGEATPIPATVASAPATTTGALFASGLMPADEARRGR
ncbi:MAG: amidophosphoribosyltransferase [Acidimicrobiales bacterium]